MAEEDPQERNPICSCGHPRTSHSRNGCIDRHPNGKMCDCKRKYMEF